MENSGFIGYLIVVALSLVLAVSGLISGGFDVICVAPTLLLTYYLIIFYPKKHQE